MSKPSRFPISDHFDGARFHNPGVTIHHGLADLIRWRRTSRPTPWPKSVENEPATPPPERVRAGELGVTFIGHASFLIQLAGLNILLDPVFSQRCSPLSWAGPKRVRPPGLALQDLPPIDLIVVSHNHYDHMDLTSLGELQRRDAPRIVTPLGNSAPMRRAGATRIEELDWWRSTSVEGLEIIAAPAQHFSSRTLFDRNRALWAGFMLKTAEHSVFFAGDSGHGPHWASIRERLGEPDVALLPIGAYEPRWFMSPVHMDPDDAVQAHLALGARLSIGMHFGTFQLTDEGIDAPRVALDDALRRFGVSENFITLPEGKTLMLGVNEQPVLPALPSACVSVSQGAPTRA